MWPANVDFVLRLLATHLSPVAAEIFTPKESFPMKILRKLFISHWKPWTYYKIFCFVFTLLVVYRWILLLFKT